MDIDSQVKSYVLQQEVTKLQEVFSKPYCWLVDLNGNSDYKIYFNEPVIVDTVNTTIIPLYRKL